LRILFNDAVQQSDAPDTIKSPILSETTEISGSITIVFDRQRTINAIGLANTDGTTFTINGQVINFNGNGLYLINQIQTNTLTITADATYIGRIGAGIGINIPTSVRKEPAYCSTANPRMTLSGQVIHGAGGYNYFGQKRTRILFNS